MPQEHTQLNLMHKITRDAAWSQTAGAHIVRENVCNKAKKTVESHIFEL